jgi:uncharacterized membrane protein YqjE
MIDKGILCIPVFMGLCCFLCTAYLKSIENNIMQNKWVICCPFICSMIHVGFSMHQNLTESEYDRKHTRKQVIFWNKMVISFFCLMLLNLAVLLYETEMDWYRRCFLCAVLALLLVLFLLVDTTSFELRHSIIKTLGPQTFFMIVNVMCFLFVILSKNSNASGNYLRYSEQVGWLILVCLIFFFEVGFLKVDDYASNDVYVSKINPSRNGSDFRVEIRQCQSF